MRLSLFLLAPFATVSVGYPSHVFNNPSPESPATLGIPSVHESTVQARRILKLASIATLSSVFPAAFDLENRPRDVQGSAIGLTEYYASCAPHSYNPTLLGITIATTYKNAAAGSNVTLSLRYHVPADAPPTDDPYAYSPANLPRFSLIGYVERIPEDEARRQNISGCFFEAHSDSRLWAPGTDIHESWWARLVVEEVYWFGGFGDRARIGWLPVEEWRGVTEDEVDAYRLIGEKGYRGYDGGADRADRAEGRQQVIL